MRRNKISTVLLVFLLLALSGCGEWYLRGNRTSAVAIKTAYLDSSSAPRLERAVARELSYSGVSFGSKTGSDAVIELSNESFDRRVLSVDPNNGKVREVELGLEVSFSVRDKDGKILVPPEKLSWVQDYIFDENSLLGTREKAEVIERELADDAAQTILLRLETLEIKSL